MSHTIRGARKTAWIETRTTLPPEGVVVSTKIDDQKGERNVQLLKRRGRLWFFADGSMYVYYTPTHWAPMQAGGAS